MKYNIIKVLSDSPYSGNRYKVGLFYTETELSYKAINKIISILSINDFNDDSGIYSRYLITKG